jgi:methylmalonyl-CoA/ethylmalonyl-CoA epimerase
MDKVFNAPDGFEAFVYPDQTLAMTVELIQPHVTSWGYPDDGGIVSKTMGIKQLQHVGVAVRDTTAAAERFQQLFGLTSTNGRLPFDNDCWLQFLAGDKAGSSVAKFLDKNGPGIEHVALATTTLAADSAKLDSAGAAQVKDNGVWIDGAHVAGTTVELVAVAA